MKDIEISITVGLTKETSRVVASGTKEHVITKKEESSFGVTDKPLKNAVGKYMGKSPDHVFVRSPTLWGDMYEMYKWPQVKTVLVVQSAQIIGIRSVPVVVARQIFTNDSSVKATFDVALSQSVTNTVTSSWTNSNKVNIEQKAKYNVGFLGTGGGGETTLAYSHAWGETTTKSKAITIGTKSGVSVVLDPGQSVSAHLSATQGVMKVRIAYQAKLKGKTAINYNKGYKNHHYWGSDIALVMEKGGIANNQTITEDIEISFYSDSKVQLINGAD